MTDRIFVTKNQREIIQAMSEAVPGNADILDVIRACSVLLLMYVNKDRKMQESRRKYQNNE